jgi:hypothetical protein
VGAATFDLLSSQSQLVPVQQVLGPAAAMALGGPALGLGAAKALLGDMFHVEWHRWGAGLRVGLRRFAVFKACATLMLSPRACCPLCCPSPATT